MASPAHASHDVLFGLHHDRIIRAIGRYYVLTAEQVRRLYYSEGSLAYSQKLLRQLTDNAYLFRVPLPRYNSFGKLPYAYLLDEQGRSHLTEQGEPVKTRFRQSEILKGARLHLAHTLAVNDVLIALDLLARQPDSLLRIREEVHEQVLKRTPDKVELSDRTSVSVIPDAVCCLVFGEVGVWVAFEIDRSTANQRVWREKVEALIAWGEGPFSTRYGSNALTFAIVATEGEDRAAELLKWTERELEKLGRADLAEFFFITGGSPLSLPPVEFVCGEHWRSPFAARPLPLLERGEIGL